MRGGRRWLDALEFEDAIAACNLLPGPTSTELAIFCAWRVRGRAGALAGGAAAATIGPWLVLILLGCGLAELALRWPRDDVPGQERPDVTAGKLRGMVALPALGAAAAGGGVLAGVAWVVFKVGALGGARYFSVLRTSRVAQAFLDGAGPAAIGAILGSAVLLAGTLREPWQFAVLAAAAVLLFGPQRRELRRGVMFTLLAAAGAGVVVALARGPLPH